DVPGAHAAQELVDARLLQQRTVRGDALLGDELWIVAERGIEEELAVLQREIGAPLLAFERLGVVAHVVAGEEGEQHQVRRIRPDALLQREELVRRAIARDAEVHRLDALARREAAALEALGQERP